jgi:hypothetical protein
MSLLSFALPPILHHPSFWLMGREYHWLLETKPTQVSLLLGFQGPQKNSFSELFHQSSESSGNIWEALACWAGVGMMPWLLGWAGLSGKEAERRLGYRWPAAGRCLLLSPAEAGPHTLCERWGIQTAGLSLTSQQCGWHLDHSCVLWVPCILSTVP